ncbi:MAG: MerR family transcriptional regulator [Desulfuromonadales bacterium]|nr:MerR family transcriptional regulator [Desulfuromonadales bacterium]
MDVKIPDKLYFKIGEVAELTGIKPHVLRYWESEFGSFRPAKSKNQQRLYRQRDVELVLHLKDLLYNQGFTIAGAKKKLRQKGGGGLPGLPASDGQKESLLLEEIRRDLHQLRQSLGRLPNLTPSGT